MGTLKTHIQSVHEDVPRKCELCGKVLKNSLNLKLHMSKMHEENRKIHKCPVCHKEYLKQSVMKEHLQVKHGEGNHEKHQCEFCEFFTYRKSHLRMHICYRKDKIKICPHCPFKSIYYGMMKVHIQREHTKNPTKFSCKNCEFTTFRKGTLTKHQKVTKCAKSQMQ